MITLKSLDETDIEVENGVITITQTSHRDYRRSYVSIPVAFWAHLVAHVEEEIANPTPDPVVTGDE